MLKSVLLIISFLGINLSFINIKDDFTIRKSTSYKLFNNCLSLYDGSDSFNYSLLIKDYKLLNTLFLFPDTQPQKVYITKKNKRGYSLLVMQLSGDSFNQCFKIDHVRKMITTDIDKDGFLELLIEARQELPEKYVTDFLLIKVFENKIDTLFFESGFEYKFDEETNPADLNILSKTIFYKLRDYDHDGIIDLKLKRIYKYPKDKKCDCDKNHFYNITNHIYYFKNGSFNSF